MGGELDRVPRGSIGGKFCGNLQKGQEKNVRGGKK